jgi:hypothetical protein
MTNDELEEFNRVNRERNQFQNELEECKEQRDRFLQQYQKLSKKHNELVEIHKRCPKS